MFPVNEQGRRFTSKNYYRKLANGENSLREWLIYSKSFDSVYCFPCKLFYSANDKCTSLFDKKGFRDWKHLSETLTSHEVSKIHVVNCNKWKMLHRSFKNNTTIDASHQKVLNLIKEHWKNILKRIISIILFLAGQNLAFRGSSEKLYVKNNGNFLKTVELLAEFDPVMKEHLNKIEKTSNLQRKTHYLGHNIQNELICHISSHIKKYIISDIQKSKYFAIILDCTPDKNRVEQLTIILRYVKANSIEVKESFIEYSPVNDTTGRGLTEVVLSKITEMGLDIKNLRGQGYDNGANMRGKNVGVQKRILDINSRAMFVPCAAHSLNLVINDAVKATFESINFFSLVQAIYVFFSVSTNRWALLKTKVKLLTLKPLSDTRWESRVESIKALKYQIGDIYDALVEISEDLTYDPTARNEADSLAKKIKKFDFLVCVVFWYEILNKINSVSKLLQSPDLNIVQSTKSLESLSSHFRGCRSDKYFQEIIVDAAELAQELEIEAKFNIETRARPRKKTRQFLYEAQDEPIIDPCQKFKIEIFFVAMDKIINSIEERFELLKVHSNYFSFLYNIPELLKITKEELTKNCLDLERYLTEEDGESKDLNGIELRDELTSFGVLIEKENGKILSNPQKSLEFIHSNDLNANLPNLDIALRILLTLPVSVASGERSFSKLKIIENYLRSSMSQERLNGLALISIENEIANNLDYDELICSFAEKKARVFF